MRNIKGLIGLAFTTCICLYFVSCENKFTVTGADGQVYENYQEACHAQDFEAAHKILARMKESNSNQYKEAREFIFNQEALYLIAQNDETSTKRLYFLLQEDANEVGNAVRDSRCNTIIDLAIKQNNVPLVEQTINQYSGIINRSLMQRIYNFFYTEGRKTDRDYILTLLKKNKSVDVFVSDAAEQKDNALLMYVIDKNALINSPNAAKIIAQYAKANNNKKLHDSLLANLRTNNQWGSILEIGLANREDNALLMYVNDKNAPLISPNAAKLIAQYAKANNNRKLQNSLLANLRTKNQWYSILEIGLANGDLTLIKQGYQNCGDKENAFSAIISNQDAWANRSIMQYMLTLVTNEDQAESLVKICMKEDNAEAVVNITKKYSSKFSESLRNTIMDYAISKNGTSFTDLVISLLKCTPIDGTPLAAGQRMTSNRPESVVSSHNDYVRSVQSFNRKCDHILSAAIAQHKRVLANKIVTLYKDVPNEYIVNEHWYQIAQTCTYSKDDKLRAQEEVNEARRRGDL